MLSRAGALAHIARMRKRRRIVVLVVPPVEELDLIGPVQVLSTSSRLMGRGGTPYEIQIVSTTRDRVIAGESGLSIVAQAHYQSLDGEIDSLLVVSGVKGRNRCDDELAAWLRRTAPVC
jgi:transcriptional regulator GlxA family with amidase domain